MTTLKSNETRCTLCSLACALGFERTAGGSVLPTYPGEIHDVRHGICGRGHLNYDLLDNALRLEQPLVRNGDHLVPTPMSQIAENLAPKLATESTLVLVSGTLACQDIVAAASLARLLGDKAVFSVTMDPADFGLLTGVAASGASLLTPEGLAECDAILCVGDAFGTHPVISRAVHALTKRNARRLFAVIDSVSSRTTKLANSTVQIRPGSTSTVLKFLVGEGASASAAATAAHVVEGTLTTLADKLKDVGKLGVMVACDFGRDQDPDAVGYLAGRIAGKTSGGVLPLPASGNGWGALGISKALNAVPTGDALGRIVDGTFKNVILLGVDVAETPLEGLAESLARMHTLVVATSLKPTAQTAGSHFLPLATPVETDGTIVNGSGEVIELTAVVKPAGGALPVRELLAQLAAKLSEGPSISTDVKSEWLKPVTTSAQECLATEVVLVEPRTGELVGVSEQGCVHIGAGTVSGRLGWPTVFEKVPVIRVSSEDAENRGLLDGKPVTVTSAGGSAEMMLRVDAGMKSGRAALMATARAVRALFSWKSSTDGRVTTGPVAVRVKAS